MLKAHYLVSKECPELSGETVAICGQVIRNPEAIPTELENNPEYLSSLRECVECVHMAQAAIRRIKGHVYICGIVEAQEAKNAQADAA